MLLAFSEPYPYRNFYPYPQLYPHPYPYPQISPPGPSYGHVDLTKPQISPIPAQYVDWSKPQISQPKPDERILTSPSKPEYPQHPEHYIAVCPPGPTTA